MIKKPMQRVAIAALSMTLAWGQHAIAAEDMTDMPGMDHSKMGHDMPPAEQDDMGGMNPGMDHSKMNRAATPDQRAMPGMDHSGSAEMSMQGGAAPAGARDPHAYSGGYDFGAIAPPRMADVAYMGGLLVNRLERAQSRDGSANAYDLQGWFGKDYERLALKAEGEVAEGKLHQARTELLWGHALATYWNTQLGVRYDSGIAPDQPWLAFGVQGLAPYWFEVDATAYIGKQGRSALRLGAEYELLLTQKLILQPRVEANLSGKQDAASEIGSGLSNLTTGLRLRYEIRRELAPYLGVEWGGKFGGTADFARAAGERSNETRLIAGARFWF